MYGLSSLVLIPVETFFVNAWALHTHIIQGTFVKYCLKPINTMFFYFSEIVEIKSLLQLFISIPILIISGKKMGIDWSFPLIGAYILYFICGSIILISIYVMAASLGFWLMNSMSIINFAGQVINFSKYPISIYGTFLKAVFTYILPIGFVSYYPMMLMLGKISYGNVVQAIVTAILFGSVGCLIWHKGVEHYSGTGS
jgi:ABC-2 type transport system permease protein